MACPATFPKFGETLKETVLITLANYQALAAFRLQLRRFFAFSATAAEAYGLAPQQYQALLAIKGHVGDGPPSISDLAGQLMIRQHTAVELANRLEKAGLVSRRPHARDGRVVVLHLTAKAETALADLAATHLEELRHNADVLVDLLKNIRSAA